MKKNFEMRVVQTFDCDTREHAEYIAREAKQAHAAYIAKHGGSAIGTIRCELVKAATKAFDSETVEGEPIPRITPSGEGRVIAEVISVPRPRRSVIANIPGCDGDGMDAAAKAKLS